MLKVERQLRMFKIERSRFEILFDILKVMQEENKAKKTRIMHRAYLNSRNFQRYFDFLLEEGFLAKYNPEPGNYMLTKKGKELLRGLKDVENVLKLAS